LFGDGFGWKVVAMGSGCGFVFGVTTRQVLAWFMRMVEGQWSLKGRRTEKNSRRQGARRNQKKFTFSKLN